MNPSDSTSPAGRGLAPDGQYPGAMADTQAPQHLIRLSDLDPDTVTAILERSIQLKRDGHSPNELAGRTAGLLFFRGSLRTRASFSAAVSQLGGHTLNLTAHSDFWELEEREGSVMDGRAPEHIKDAARALSSYTDLLAIRPAPPGQSWAVDKKDAQIRSWARWANVPVINMESALWHPLQSLADLMTLQENLGDLEGKRLAITWVHSPTPSSHAVVNSLLCAALARGMQVRVAHPNGFELDESVLKEARGIADRHSTELSLFQDPKQAVDGAQVVYARSWGSLADYGNKTLAASHIARFSDWKVDERLMALGDPADGGARLMHAMPVRRNVEVTDAVLDGPRSVVQAQAENRLHSMKALLTQLWGA